MNEIFYELYLSNKKQPVELGQIQAEKLIMALVKNQRPQFVLTEDGELVNTSYIVAITMKEYNWTTVKKLKLTSEQEKLHQQYLQIKKSLLEEPEIFPQLK